MRILANRGAENVNIKILCLGRFISIRKIDHDASNKRDTARSTMEFGAQGKITYLLVISSSCIKLIRGIRICLEMSTCESFRKFHFLFREIILHSLILIL